MGSEDKMITCRRLSDGELVRVPRYTLVWGFSAFGVLECVGDVLVTGCRDQYSFPEVPVEKGDWPSEALARFMTKLTGLELSVGPVLAVGGEMVLDDTSPIGELHQSRQVFQVFYLMETSDPNDLFDVRDNWEINPDGPVWLPRAELNSGSFRPPADQAFRQLYKY